MKIKNPTMLPMVDRKENLAVAYSIIGGIPVKNFDLNQFCSTGHNAKPTPTCGTIGCTLGWLAMHPYFTAQGLYLEHRAVKLIKPNGDRLLVDHAAEYLFGHLAYSKYFKSFGHATWDDDLCSQEGLYPCDTGNKQSHKILALARLKRGYKRIH